MQKYLYSKVVFSAEGLEQHSVRQVSTN